MQRFAVRCGDWDSGCVLQEDTWVVLSGLEDASTFEKYITAIYWSMSTLCTVRILLQVSITSCQLHIEQALPYRQTPAAAQRRHTGVD